MITTNKGVKTMLDTINELAEKYAKDFLYCDPDEFNERSVWEPFENWDESDLEILKADLIESFKQFYKEATHAN